MALVDSGKLVSTEFFSAASFVVNAFENPTVETIYRRCPFVPQNECPTETNKLIEGLTR